MRRTGNSARPDVESWQALAHEDEDVDSMSGYLMLDPEGRWRFSHELLPDNWVDKRGNVRREYRPFLPEMVYATPHGLAFQVRATVAMCVPIAEQNKGYAMRFYVGVTDNAWYQFLAERRPDEVNFWQPSDTRSFRTIAPGARLPSGPEHRRHHPGPAVLPRRELVPNRPLSDLTIPYDWR